MGLMATHSCTAPSGWDGVAATARAAVEREFGRLKNEWALLPLRVRGLERVQLHADLTILAKLSCTLARARAVRSRRSSKVKDPCVVRCSTSRASFATTGIGVSSASRSASL